MKVAAGLVLYRISPHGSVELFLAHLGGPYFARKDDHGWVVPKGLVEPEEDVHAAAQREWTEETGQPVPDGTFLPLPPIKQSGKTNRLFLVRGDVDPAACRSNEFELEWPPKSGQLQSFPEVDRYGWFSLADAERKLVKALGSLPVVVQAALSA